ncbi:peptidoglycan editing factor PgeF [Corynebacterium gerontici]|uniref:Purine nucleoside phosphorylase n=1 Tax=Corynebacterium gerontici TaxID=2079234 RepID=A0A3G6J231_9CORY|nr:peptidoglycan editing factor PgeF [Corynebacterium gerontici]AZA11763.1 Laccase domain protein YfiH [Corynebacterium gerontici]
MLKENSRPVRKVFTTKAGGVSRGPYASFNLAEHVGDEQQCVQDNRKRLQRILGVQHLQWMEQIHSNTVQEVKAVTEEPIAACDSIVTTLRGVALGVLVADCVPVLLSDHEAGVIAAVHAGRLGARNGIVQRSVEAMRDLGAVPERIHALLGPAASGRNYEVPEAMAADVEARLPGSRVLTDKGTPGLDIRRGLLVQLRGLGVHAIHADPRCTIEDEQFFSYRREGVTGRFAGVTWLPDV